MAAVYANARVGNPDGIEGIKLHVDAGPDWSVNFAPPTPTDYCSTPVPFKEVGWVNYWVGQYMSSDRAKLFYHAQMINDIGDDAADGQVTSSGSFVFDLLRYFKDTTIPPIVVPTDSLPYIIVHELGHNLGLGHGGFEHLNHKPNYESIMNYSGLGGYMLHKDGTKGTRLGYSYGDNINLDESDLHENWGIGGKEFTGIDWNCSGSIEVGAYPLKIWHPDYDMVDSRQTKTLKDHDDWGNLKFKQYGYFQGSLKETLEEEPFEEITEYFPWPE